MTYITWQPMPPSKKNGEIYYCPRLKGNGSPINLMQLCKLAAKDDKFDEGYIYACYDRLLVKITELLKEGRTIDLGELGTLSLSLGTKKPIRPTDFNHTRNVYVKGVNYTPSAELLQKLQDQKFKYFAERPTKSNIDKDEAMCLLNNYFESHASIKFKEFCNLTNLHSTTGHKLIKELVNDGFLKVEGYAMYTTYVPNKSQNT